MPNTHPNALGVWILTVAPWLSGLSMTTRVACLENRKAFSLLDRWSAETGGGGVGASGAQQPSRYPEGSPETPERLMPITYIAVPIAYYLLARPSGAPIVGVRCQ